MNVITNHDQFAGLRWLDPSVVGDTIGSDRLSGWQDDATYEALRADIERRGQRQPIHVRGTEQALSFSIMSGRRRLAVARDLGRPVLVFVHGAGGNTAEDLEERFAENHHRSSLPAFAWLLSVAQVAEALPDLTQTQIAKRLGIAQSDVSLALDVRRLETLLLAEVDTTTVSKRALRKLVPQFKRGKPSTRRANTGCQFSRQTSFGQVRARTTSNGDLVLSIKGKPLGFLQAERLVKAIADTVSAEFADLDDAELGT